MLQESLLQRLIIAAFVICECYARATQGLSMGRPAALFPAICLFFVHSLIFLFCFALPVFPAIQIRFRAFFNAFFKSADLKKSKKGAFSDLNSPAGAVVRHVR